MFCVLFLIFITKNCPLGSSEVKLFLFWWLGKEIGVVFQLLDTVHLSGQTPKDITVRLWQTCYIIKVHLFPRSTHHFNNNLCGRALLPVFGWRHPCIFETIILFVSQKLPKEPAAFPMVFESWPWAIFMTYYLIIFKGVLCSFFLSNIHIETKT